VAQLARHLIDLLEAHASDLADDEVRVILQDGQNIVAELLDQRAHLVVRQPESGEQGQGGIDVAGFPPVFPQRLDGRVGDVRGLGQRFRLLVESPVEVPAEAIREHPRLLRADSLDLRMVR
jgi:hypothetical protein